MFTLHSCGDDMESERKMTKHIVVFMGCKAINHRPYQTKLWLM